MNSHLNSMCEPEKIIPIILSGGAGTRLWPLSRRATPKQFLNVIGSKSLIHQTLERCSGDMFDNRPILVGAAGHQGHLTKAVSELGLTSDILLEPVPRNSCAAVAAGALRALERNTAALVMVLASDHYVPDTAAFQNAVLEARTAADAGSIVTFGVAPTAPSTSYGYILPDAQGTGARPILRFVEKPDAETASAYIAEGYFWNSGNFLFSAQVFIDELKKFAPDIYASVTASLDAATRSDNVIWLAEQAFAQSPDISVDYAVLEKTSRAAVLPVHYCWSDVGSWDSVMNSIAADGNGCAVFGRCVVNNSRNVMVHSESLLTVVEDCEDILVIVTRDAVLVTRRGRSEKLKTTVAQLTRDGFSEVSTHHS
jgi:mannose-1-phosphate guanylyltransferase/mannose-6-phosphate isomerase